MTNSTTMPHLIARAHGSVLAVAGQLDSSALDDELANLLGQQAGDARDRRRDSNGGPNRGTRGGG